MASYWLHFVGNRERGYYHGYSLSILKQSLYSFSTFSDLLFLYRLYWHRKQNLNDKFIHRTLAQKRLREPFQKSIQRLMKNSIIFRNTIDNPIKIYGTNNLGHLGLLINRYLLNQRGTCHNTHTYIKRKQKSDIWTETSETFFKWYLGKEVGKNISVKLLGIKFVMSQVLTENRLGVGRQKWFQ